LICGSGPEIAMQPIGGSPWTTAVTRGCAAEVNRRDVELRDHPEYVLPGQVRVVPLPGEANAIFLPATGR